MAHLMAAAMQAGSRASLREKGRATNKERLSQRNCGCDEPLCWFVIYCLKRLRTTAAQVGMLLNLRNNHITDSKHNYSSPSFVLSFLNALALYIKSDRAEWCIAVLGCIWMYLKGVHISMHSLCDTIKPPYAFHALCDDLQRGIYAYIKHNNPNTAFVTQTENIQRFSQLFDALFVHYRQCDNIQKCP